ncbi:hypothetical protein [Antarcticimicrobium sediminis]|uniref:hypothetical protein n=1 Tax=Antarcticimicrobium sediminis TaxID=2546227 RepID=UPI001FDF286F|nr:hypothetical protein [Antarcticimicrobium sediminis]
MIGPYQLDPAEALRWSRDQLPVFYAETLGYWVVTRYDDIKAVFRDGILFSPRNVLEKITPATPEAMEVLKSYGYAMNRTMVNEDEPAHMERRRALMDHFIPANLEHHQEMVRRLTREKMDAFIDEGRVDLVESLLYEVPLNVALHFLGVPEDEIAVLRNFSVAHSVNTWGKPTDEQQIAITHDVGQFWQHAGTVIEKMKAEPEGTGWMHETIRKNAEMPLMERLQADHSGHLSLQIKDDGARADLTTIVAALPEGGQIYCCGPERMITATACCRAANGPQTIA